MPLSEEEILAAPIVPARVYAPVVSAQELRTKMTDFFFMTGRPICTMINRLDADSLSPDQFISQYKTG